MKQLRRPKKFVFRKNMDAEKISAKLSKGEPFFIVMGLVDAVPMIAVGLALYVLFAVAG